MKALVVSISLFTLLAFFAESVLAESPTPTVAGTVSTSSPTVVASPSAVPPPLPVPTDIKVAGTAVLLDDNNFPLPPERQKHTIGVNWDAASGFVGTYEVERARIPFGGTPSRSYDVVSRLAAMSAKNGRLSFEEPYAIGKYQQYCYRIRSSLNGQFGGYSGEVCTQPVPTSGSGVGAAPTSGMFLRYAKTMTTATFRWLPVPDSPGEYEVERAYNKPWEGADRNFVLIATVRGTPGADGWMSYEEQVPILVMWDNPPCYRVRTVIDAERRGEYSAVRCAFLAPDTPPPPGRLPGTSLLPPAAGSGMQSSRDDHAGYRAWGLLFVLLGVGVLNARRVTASRRKRG